MNGGHAHRLERLEQRVDELHDNLDEFAEAEAANATNIVGATSCRFLRVRPEPSEGLIQDRPAVSGREAVSRRFEPCEKLFIYLLEED